MYERAEISRHLRCTGNAFEVRVEPEPTNPVDARAIAFQCKVDATSKTIGYVVSEVLDDVHLAISTDSIKEVDLSGSNLR